jgi:hypothetical protein
MIGSRQCYTFPMLMQARKLVVMLLVLLLPWQSFAALAVSPASHHHDAATEIGHLASVAATHHGHEHYAANQHHDHAGAPSDPDGSAASASCTDVCCSPALVTIDPVFAATIGHSWVIPFAMHRPPSRAPDRLERPPCSFLV